MLLQQFGLLCCIHVTGRSYKVRVTQTWFGVKTHLSHTHTFPLQNTMTKDNESIDPNKTVKCLDVPCQRKEWRQGHHIKLKIQRLSKFITKNLRTFSCVVLTAGVKLQHQRTAWKQCRINPPGSDLRLKLYRAGFCHYCLHKYIFCWSSGTKVSHSKGSQICPLSEKFNQISFWRQ